MGIQIDGKPVNGKFFAEWALDLAGTLVVGLLVWDIFKPASPATTEAMGFPIVVTGLASYGALKLLRTVKWIDK